MLFHLAVAKFIDLGYEAVEEVTVVGDHNEGTVKGKQSLLENVFGAQIEVVGGLVKNQQIHRFKQKFDHGKTSALATRKHLDFFIDIVPAKHKGSKQVPDLRADISHSYIVNCLKNSQVFVKKRGLILSKIANLHIMSQG